MVFESIRGSEQGSVLPFFAVSMAMIMGFCAISIDAGRMYAQKLLLRNATDAAALAGVRYLPHSPAMAIQTATDFARLNGVDPAHVTVTIEGDTGQRLRVQAQHQVRLEFAGIIASGIQTISATSVAISGATRRTKGAQPFGIEEAPFVPGQQYVLKFDSKSKPGPLSGNFHALALGSRGADDYRNNVQYGYQGYIAVGDIIETEPGNMEGPTQQGLAVRLNADPSATYENHLPTSPRILLIPVVNSFDVNGRKMVQVKGFASFFLEDYRSTSSGPDAIVGRFVSRVIPGDVDETGMAPNYGTTSIKLIR